MTAALYRTGDLFTARAAAERVNVSQLESLVLSALERAAAHGMTAHEVAAELGRDLVSISPRMRPLVKKGKVREAGRRDGRTVWQHADATPYLDAAMAVVTAHATKGGAR